MSDARIYPKLEAFERLHIRDGMTINAELWQQAHRYHRQRQNFHYQALHQPGIVCGLGVTPPDPTDGRLLQVQPGIAIDREGNPIIVNQPEEFRIVSEAPPDGVEGQSLLVYLVVNYVDPDDLRHSSSKRTVQENFRIVEKLQLDSRDVELCRIQLLPGATQIQSAPDVFFPAANQFDFRYRRYPAPYPQLQVQVGQIVGDRPTDTATFNGLTDLLQALPGLYPLLHGSPTVQPFPAIGLGQQEMNCHLLYIPYDLLLTLSNPALQILKGYLDQGGVLLVAADFTDVNLLDLLNIGQELHSGLAEVTRDHYLMDQMGARLQLEITANQDAVTQRLVELEQSLAEIAPKLGLTLTGTGELELNHPLRWQPFGFSQFPQRLGHSIMVKNWGGLVWMVGDLSYGWGRNALPQCPREVLRSAQEWGINLLHFAAQRHQWHHAMKPFSTVSDPSPDSLQRRVQSS